MLRRGSIWISGLISEKMARWKEEGIGNIGCMDFKLENVTMSFVCSRIISPKGPTSAYDYLHKIESEQIFQNMDVFVRDSKSDGM